MAFNIAELVGKYKDMLTQQIKAVPVALNPKTNYFSYNPDIQNVVSTIGSSRDIATRLSNPYNWATHFENFGKGMARTMLEAYQNTPNTLSDLGSNISGVRNTKKVDLSPLKNIWQDSVYVTRPDPLSEGSGRLTANIAFQQALGNAASTSPFVKDMQAGLYKAGGTMQTQNVYKQILGRGITGLSSGIPYTVTSPILSLAKGKISPQDIVINAAIDTAVGMLTTSGIESVKRMANSMSDDELIEGILKDESGVINPNASMDLRGMSREDLEKAFIERAKKAKDNLPKPGDINAPNQMKIKNDPRFSKYDASKGADADYQVFKDMDESNPLKKILREKYATDPRFNPAVSKATETAYNPTPEQYKQDAEALIKRLNDTDQITEQEAKDMLGLAEINAQNKGTIKSFKDTFTKWLGRSKAAELRGIQKAYPFKDIEDGMALVDYIEDPSKPATEAMKQQAKDMRKLLDELYKEAKDVDPNIKYRENYIPHQWAQSPDQIQQILDKQSLNTKFKYATPRDIPTYEAGRALGLTPKYDNPAQMIADYVKALEKVKANKDFIKQLKEANLVVPAGVGSRQRGFSPIVADGFPNSKVILKGKELIGEYYAPTNIANMINRVFAEQDNGLVGTALDKTANLSGTIQNLTLSGGAPGTPLNAFSAAQLQKEYLAGNLVEPTKSFARSFSDKASRDYFAENIQPMIEMRSEGIPVGGNLDIKSMMGEQQGGVFQKVMENPTFQRFMPQLQIESYKAAKAQALKQGLDESEAIRVGALATKNWTGAVDYGTSALRPKIQKDLTKTFLFAPPYREAMINFWINAFKGLQHPFAIENRATTKFLIGATLTYVAMDRANQALNGGKHMKDNPPGTEDKLLIPYKGGYVGVPFLSSIATMPRLVYRDLLNLKEGDIVGASKDTARTSLSSLVKPFAEAWSNEDYFGSPVYNENSTPAQQNKAMFLHVFKSWVLAHPYLSTVFNKAVGKTKDEPAEITFSKMMELPFRYYTRNNLNSKHYYNEKEKALQTLTPEERKIYDGIQASKKLDEDLLPVNEKRGEMGRALDLMAHPNIMRAESMAAIATAEKTGEALNPYYTLNPEQQYTIQLMKTLYPGSKEKSVITNANISWLKPYWAAQQAYFEELKYKGVLKPVDKIDVSFDAQTATPDNIRPTQDAYFNLPYGTGQRSAYIRAHPELAAWWDTKAEIVNKQREQLGLPAIADSSGGGSSKKRYIISLPKGKFSKIRVKSSKSRNIRIKRPKLAKVKIKVKSVSTKIGKFRPKAKLAKIRASAYRG